MAEIKATIGGQEYELVCTTAAYVEICKKYGGIEEMAEVIQGPEINEWDSDEVRQQKEDAAANARNKVFEVIPWLLAVLANQGTMLRGNKTSLSDEEKLTEEKVLLYTLPKEIKDLTPIAMEAITAGFSMEHQAPEVDPTLAELEKQERKNGESAAV